MRTYSYGPARREWTVRVRSRRHPPKSKSASRARRNASRALARVNTVSALSPLEAPAGSRIVASAIVMVADALVLLNRQTQAAFFGPEVRSRTQNIQDARLPNTIANDGSATPPGCQIIAVMRICDERKDCELPKWREKGGIVPICVGRMRPAGVYGASRRGDGHGGGLDVAFAPACSAVRSAIPSPIASAIWRTTSRDAFPVPRSSSAR
jgi:hypothetical protein